MAFQFAIAFSSLFVEDKNLIALNQIGNHFANHLGSFYRRSAHDDVALFVNQQNSVKFNCRSSLHFAHVVNEQLTACLSLKLLAVDFYNCVHYCNTSVKLDPSGGL